MVSSVSKIGSQILSFPKPLIRGAKVGLSFAASLASHTSLATVGALYANYLLLSAAFNSLSKYAGQYAELQEGLQSVGFTPNTLGKYFYGQQASLNSWDVLQYAFDPKNLKDIQSLLNDVYESIEDPFIMQAMTAQILTKLLVNKNAHYLVNGSIVKIPVVDEKGNKQLVEYRLDKKFDLWSKIPAFGFSSIEENFPPLLIFRSTNTLLEEADTLPTIVANLHPEGPGWKLFTHSQQDILQWLQEKKDKSSQAARVIGYSLGGTIAAYYLAYYPSYFSNATFNPSIILDAPGVNAQIEKKWGEIAQKPHVLTFVNRGDVIPKIGQFLVGRAFEVRIAQNLSGFESHQALSFFAPQWKIVEISTHCEKKSKARNLLSGLRNLVGSAIYMPVKTILLPCMQEILHG